MVWAPQTLQKIGFTVRKRIGRPVGCGWAMCGWSHCGEYSDFAGVYQMRYSDKGRHIGQPRRGHKYICFMRPCWKAYEYTDDQKIQTDKFKAAMSAWQGLTDEQKAYYNEIADRKGRRGYNYFLSLTLNT